MKYLPEILMFIAWPMFIYLCYKACSWAIKKYDKKQLKF